MNNIPSELIVQILKQLSSDKDLLQCVYIDKHWGNLASEDRFYKSNIACRNFRVEGAVKCNYNSPVIETPLLTKACSFHQKVDYETYQRHAKNIQLNIPTQERFSKLESKLQLVTLEKTKLEKKNQELEAAQKKKEEDSSICIICLDNPSGYLLSPYYHMVYCQTCALLVRRIEISK